MTTPLSPLERAAAQAVARQFPDHASALLAQLATAMATHRDFTGVGFFTEISVDRTLPPAPPTHGPIGDIESRVGPGRYALEFMLYVPDGYIETLEAYSFEQDGYGDLDLLTCDFTQPAELHVQRP